MTDDRLPGPRFVLGEDVPDGGIYNAVPTRPGTFIATEFGTLDVGVTWPAATLTVDRDRFMAALWPGWTTCGARERAAWNRVNWDRLVAPRVTRVLAALAAWRRRVTDSAWGGRP